MRRGRASALACALVFTLGCASALPMPASRFDSPEARGRFGPSRLEASALQSGHAVQIQPDGSARLQSAPVHFMTGFGVGLNERFDAGLRVHPSGPLLLRGKFQVAGEPELRAQSGNLSAAITASAGIALASAGTPAAPLASSYLMFDGGLIVGYRVSRVVLPYGQGFFGTFPFSGSIQGSSFSGSASQLGFGLGARLLWDDLWIHLEVNRASASAGTDERAQYLPGVAVGLMLGPSAE